jgi:hypothetical protein
VAENWYKPTDEGWLDSSILVNGNYSGHLEFKNLSRIDKSKWILNHMKHLTEEPDSPIYTKKGRKGYWYVPCYTSIKRDLSENRKVNRYLHHQHQRIVKCLEESKMELAFRIFTTLLQRSWGFRVACINKAVKGWFYQHNLKYLESWLKTLDMDLRKLNFDVKFFRVYIPKGNSKTKFRPLGVPALNWRVILYMHTSFLNLIIPQAIDLPSKPQQFGFLPGRNARQAWLTVLERLREGKKLYEFDLDGCFNRISSKHVTKYLEDLGVPQYYTTYLEGLLSSSPLQLEDEDQQLKEEREIVRGPDGRLWKYGLPQGFSISPLLTVFVIDRAMKKAGIKDYVMYADDGIITAESDSNRNGFSPAELRVLNEHGMYLSSKLKKDGTPSCRWIDDQFTFLGVRFSITRWGFWVPMDKFQEKLRYVLQREGGELSTIGHGIRGMHRDWDTLADGSEGVWIPADLVNDRIWNILLYNNEGDTSLDFSNKTKDWEWEIDPSSFALVNRDIASNRNWLLIMKYIRGNLFIKRVAGTLHFLDAQKESTLSSRTLLNMKAKFMRGTVVKRVRMESMFEFVPWNNMPPIPHHTAHFIVATDKSGQGRFKIIRETRNKEHAIYTPVTSAPPDPLAMIQDPDLVEYSRQHNGEPTFRQRIIIERRQRRLRASWGTRIRLADNMLAHWVRPEDWVDSFEDMTTMTLEEMDLRSEEDELLDLLPMIKVKKKSG